LLLLPRSHRDIIHFPCGNFRITADGVLDTSFAVTVMSFVNFNPIITITLTLHYRNGCAGDNKLVILGDGNQVMRLNENGTLDI